MTDNTSSINYYEALKKEVDSFSNRVMKQESQSITCKKGCYDCCHPDLSFLPIESYFIKKALSKLSQDSEHIVLNNIHQKRTHCLLLDDDKKCLIYSNRPIVCRTQGLPIYYAELEESLNKKLPIYSQSNITWCEKNFQDKKPHQSSILNGDVVNTKLAAINIKFTKNREISTKRSSIIELIHEVF